MPGSFFLTGSPYRKAVVWICKAVYPACRGRLLFLVLAAALLSACASPPWLSADGLTAAQTETTVPAAPTSQDITTETPQPPAAVEMTPTPLPPVPAAEYLITARLDFEQRVVVVEQNITADNPAAGELTELLLAVEANRQAGVFTLDGLTWADGTPVENYALDGPVLRITPATPIGPGASIGLKLNYTLRLQPMYSFLGWTGRQLNLGDWYPFLPAYREGPGWLIHDLSGVGEHLVYPLIDYHVVLELAPYERPLVVAASSPAQVEGSTYTFDMPTARGFALSISPDFRVLSTSVGDVEIRAYIFAEHESAGMASIQTVRDAVAYFSEIYAPYPHSSMSVVEADFFDGMEFSGLFFLGADYFAAYPGSPTTYLVPLSAHETAHQWWYSLVGNDPALQPWLDEAFCTHSEALFYEHYHPDLVDWWWNYRVWRFLPEGKVSSSIYDQRAFRPYVDAVYLQGTKFLDATRRAMGDEAFLAFFQDYAARYAGRLADTEGALQLLQEHSQQDLSEIIAEYFGDLN